MKRSIVAIATLLCQATASGAAPAFELVDGDRVVLIGGTLIERDQSFGYLETRLTRRYPDRSIIFRNLGWSGDTPEGISQAGFGTPADGFKHLVDHVLTLKPTVIILGYGANEAFDGKAGLPKFLRDLDKLLKAIEPTKARLVFLSPTRQEDLGPPLPDPTRHNADLALYRDALKAEAEKRGAAFVDLFEVLPDGAKATPRRPLTNNGIHFNPYGYWRESSEIEAILLDNKRFLGGGLVNSQGFVGTDEAASNDGSKVKLSFAGPDFTMKVQELSSTAVGVRFKLLDKILPAPACPGGGMDWLVESRELSIPSLKSDRYTLKVDGKPVATADADAWKKGVKIRKGPEFDQAEALRSAINAKNELYFYRWRPQNETYLFGFRKHEQGQNAREIPQFDPLVAAKEAEIAKLRKPVPHDYELTREGEVGR